jgi:hypothetical protein
MLFMDDDIRKLAESQAVKVSAENARMHALHALYNGVGGNLRGFSGWENARIPSSPRVVYDLAGPPVFYDFPVRIRERVGFIRVGANKVYGTPVISMHVTPPLWDLEKAKKALRQLAREQYPRHVIANIRLVCYRYPELGLQAVLRSPDGKNDACVLLDIEHHVLVPLEPPGSNLGQAVYSLLATFSRTDYAGNPKAWERAHASIMEFFQVQKNLKETNYYRLTPRKRLAILRKVFDPAQQKVVTFCCHSDLDHYHCQQCLSFCRHYQEKLWTCAPTSGQMLLCYWRYCFSQDEIAKAMKCDGGGTDPKNIPPGMQLLTHNLFSCTMLTTEVWTTCTGEIDNRRPFMSCVEGHARACGGYGQSSNLKFLYIFDPGDTGGICWETFPTPHFAAQFTFIRREPN